MSAVAVLATELEGAWRRSDEIFSLLVDRAYAARPIPLRHPFLFYLGHLPAFAWNQIGGGTLRRPSLHPAFEDLFERGIDPDTSAVGNGAPSGRTRWPRVEEVLAYRDKVRAELRGCLEDVAARGEDDLMCARGRIVHAVIEHELEHHETLLYMLQQLEGALKRPPGNLPALSFPAAASPRDVPIPAGAARLGADFEDLEFGWDNEFAAHEVSVPAFRIDATPVMNGEYFEFVECGAYDDPRYWSTDAWTWRREFVLRHPLSWRRAGTEWLYRGLFEDLPLTRVFDWPVMVSWAEARAYATWKGRRLPTEAEFHRAAYGTPAGGIREHPWGDEHPEARHGNFDFAHWTPTPVGSHPDGASAFGVQELVGNGWEWTCTRFEPFPGFQAYMPHYPGYSADFFDEDHYVLLGGSWATARRLLRRSFRNWFRPHYPYVFAKFRCVS